MGSLGPIYFVKVYWYKVDRGLPVCADYGSNSPRHSLVLGGH